MGHKHGPGCSHGHDHAHGHGHAHGASGKSLAYAFALTLGFMFVEAAGGYVTGSLALISDAGHMLTDAGALGVGLLALRLGARPATTRKTFGYKRLEILAGLLNGLTLWAIVGVILREAWSRLEHPAMVDAVGMSLVAVAGLLVNVLCAWLLHRHKDENLNLKGAYLHVLADLLGSVGALGAALVIKFTGYAAADPIVSCLICALILWSTWGLLVDSFNSMLLGVPPHIDYSEVEKALLNVPEVCCVYDLHIWSIATGKDALSAHVVVSGREGIRGGVLRRIEEVLSERFSIAHSTIQVEEDHAMKETREPGCYQADTHALKS